MDWWEKILLIAWLGFCLSMMAGGSAWGGDCTSPGDCATRDNSPLTAFGGGVLGGGALAVRSRRKRKPKPIPKPKPKHTDPCQAELDAVAAARTAMQQAWDQSKVYADKMEKDRMNKNFWKGEADQILKYLKEEASNPNPLFPTQGSAPRVLDSLPSDLTEITGQQKQTVLDLNLPDSQEFVDEVNKSQQAIRDYNTDKGNWQHYQDEFDKAENQLKDAQAVLAECQQRQGQTEGPPAVA